MRRLSLLVAAGMAAAGFTGSAGAATFTFPGCAPTLVECMQDAPEGSTIRLRTNGAVTVPGSASGEEITLDKGLRLVAARGYRPLIRSSEGTAYLYFAISTPGADAIVRGIRFRHVGVSVHFATGGGHRAVFDRNRMFTDRGILGGFSASVAEDAQASVFARDNTIAATSSGLHVTAASGTLEVIRNHITGTNTTQGVTGITANARGGSVEGLIANNVVHHLEDCGACSGARGIEADAYGSGTSYDVRVLNNTVHDVGTGNAFLFLGSSSWPDARTTLALFNNTASAADYGFFIQEDDPEQVQARGGGNNAFDVMNNPLGTDDVGTVTTHQPRFVDAEAGDLRLRPRSALRDGGHTCIPGSPLPRSDAHGGFRVAGRAVDVGGIEFGSRLPGSIAGRNRTGDDGRDTLNGTRGVDLLCGLGAWDRLYGRAGNDFLFGGDGNDRLFGNEGRDRLILADGVSGNDRGNGGPGRDTCVKDAGDTVTACP